MENGRKSKGFDVNEYRDAIGNVDVAKCRLAITRMHHQISQLERLLDEHIEKDSHAGCQMIELPGAATPPVEAAGKQPFAADSQATDYVAAFGNNPDEADIIERVNRLTSNTGSSKCPALPSSRLPSAQQTPACAGIAAAPADRALTATVTDGSTAGSPPAAYAPAPMVDVLPMPTVLRHLYPPSAASGSGLGDRYPSSSSMTGTGCHYPPAPSAAAPGSHYTHAYPTAAPALGRYMAVSSAAVTNGHHPIASPPAAANGNHPSVSPGHMAVGHHAYTHQHLSPPPPFAKPPATARGASTTAAAAAAVGVAGHSAAEPPRPAGREDTAATPVPSRGSSLEAGSRFVASTLKSAGKGAVNALHKVASKMEGRGAPHSVHAHGAGLQVIAPDDLGDLDEAPVV